MSVGNLVSEIDCVTAHYIGTETATFPRNMDRHL